MGRIYENLQNQTTIPPQDIATRYKEKEMTRTKETKERQERYAAREKLRQDTETYGDIFVDWEKIMREKEIRLRQEEEKRNMRLKKSEQLGGTWELIRVCKSFLEEWENDWTESEQKSKMRQEERNEVWEKEDRFRKIDIKKKEIKKKLIQTRIDFCVSKLGEKDREEFKFETRKERIELQELRMNLWRWRENGGGKTKSGKEKQNVPTEKSNLRKLKFLEELLEKEKKENERCKKLKEKEKSSKIEEEEKRQIRLEIKRTLELKWQTIRWASDHLERNNEEFGELLRDVEKREEEELNKWKKMKRFEKIEKLMMAVQMD